MEQLPAVKTQKVWSAPDIYRIVVPSAGGLLPRSNAYLVDGKGEHLLIDTCTPSEGSGERLKEALRRLGVRLDELSVLLTHLDLDHSGNLLELAPLGQGVHLCQAERSSVAACDGAKLEALYLEEGFRPDDAALISQMYKSVTLSLDDSPTFRYVQDGDVLNVGAHRFHVIGTPGHTAGHISLLEERSGVFIGGDCLLFGVTPSICLSNVVHGMVGETFRTFAKLLEICPQALLPGHGRVVADPSQIRARVEELEAHHRQKLADVLQIVREGGGLPGFSVIERMRWGLEKEGWDALSYVRKGGATASGLSYLNYLVEAGEIRRIRKDDEGCLYVCD